MVVSSLRLSWHAALVVLGVVGFGVLSLEASVLHSRVEMRPDNADCCYSTRENAHLLMCIKDTNGVPVRVGSVRVSTDNYGAQKICPDRVFDLSVTNPVMLEASRATPGFIRFQIESVTTNVLQVEGNPYWGYSMPKYTYGIAFDRDKIVSGTPDVADFDAFWANAVKQLDATVSVDAKVELMPELSKTGPCNYYRLSVATWGARRIWGWFSEPKDTQHGPYPVAFTVAGAGIGFAQPGRGDAKSISCWLNVHSYRQAEGEGPAANQERKRRYDAQDAKYAAPCGVKRYCQAGIHKSREDYFYYASVLGLNRAVDFVATRPLADSKRVSYSGTSQGGGMGLALTYLNRYIARSVVAVPAITDLLGNKVENRQSGWPCLIEAQTPENKCAAERNAPYFCGVNFARRIRKPIRFIVGFADNTCPPAAVLSAYNACPSADKDIWCGIAMSHRVYSDIYDLSGAWQHDWTSQPSVEKGTYRFLAFNIWGDFFGNPPHERDLGQAELIRRWNPDIIGMQEVTPNFWKSRIFSALSNEWTVVGAQMGAESYYTHAPDPVLYRTSRFTCIDKGMCWYCPELDASKGVVWVVLQDRRTSARLLVFASHFWWRWDGPGDDWIRLNNAQLLRKTLFDVAQKYNAAIIGGGDLNSPMTHKAMKYLISHGLADAQQTATLAPRSFPSEHGDPRRDQHGVYRGTPAIRGMCTVNPKFLWLDHIFYDPTRIVVDRFSIDVSTQACSLSDHHPIVSDFHLKP